MFEVTRVNDMLGPFKWMCGLGIGFNEAINRLAQPPEGGHAQSSQCLAPQDAKPDFDLVKPGCMGGRIVEMDHRMLRQPAIMFWFVSLKIIQDHMKLFVRILSHNLIHKVEELPATTAVVMSDFHHSRSYFQGSEQGGGAMPLILMAKAAQSLSVRQTKPSLVPFKRLNRWLFIHTDYDGVLGRLQIQSNDISRLLGELGVGADAPTVAPLKVDTVASKYSPNVVRRDISQLMCNQCSCPTAISRWWIRVQQGKDAAFCIPIISRLLTRTRCIFECIKARLQKPLTPPYHHGTRQPNLLRYRLISHPIRSQ